jgi:glycosyltransferase involved in cell wall biosynthesis
MDISTSRPTARCLDLSRLISRVGRGPWTGIDRVEFQYLQALIADDTPVFALARLPGGYVLFHPTSVKILTAWISVKRQQIRSQALAWLVQNPKVEKLRNLIKIHVISDTWIRKNQLVQRLKNELPAGTCYLNVGHSNISDEVFAAFQTIQNSRISVMLHDTIPLDFPQFQRPETVAKFADKLGLVGDNANLIICNSNQTKIDVIRQLRPKKKLPEFATVHLGVVVAEPTPADLPINLDLSRPYFVAIGTIEPRKNHKLLLDIWQSLAEKPDAPLLFIVGQRGWNNQVVFDRLDQGLKSVIELPKLTDGAVTALLQRAQALLFPSFSEGFGLPAAEAAKMGVPVICSPLRVFREVLGEYPIYADVSDMYAWQEKISKLAQNGGGNDIGGCSLRQAITVPTWDEHFNLVLKLT